MKHDLFNEKTIKRLCSNVDVTLKQKKTAQEWLKLLESGVLEKERKNYFKFAGYVLENILGYSLRKDLDHEEANIEFSIKDSKGQTVLCIEAKGEPKDLFARQAGYKKEQETPFKQTWDDMGRIASIRYGICTNYKDFILIDKSKGYSRYHFFDFLSIKEDAEKLKENGISENSREEYESKIVNTKEEVIRLSNLGFDCQPIGTLEWLMRKKILGQLPS